MLRRKTKHSKQTSIRIHIQTRRNTNHNKKTNTRPTKRKRTKLQRIQQTTTINKIQPLHKLRKNILRRRRHTTTRQPNIPIRKTRTHHTTKGQINNDIQKSRCNNQNKMPNTTTNSNTIQLPKHILQMGDNQN